MSRLFTIQFPIRDQQYTALVSLYQQQYNLTCSVQYLNKEVEAFLPDRKIVFSLAGGIESPQKITDAFTEELVRQTSDAIAQHLELET